MANLDFAPLLQLFSQLPDGFGKFIALLALAAGIGILFAIKAPGGIAPEAWMSWDD